eukprot:9604024-Alexandrium_andersonii.AAC.1
MKEGRRSTVHMSRAQGRASVARSLGSCGAGDRAFATLTFRQANHPNVFPSCGEAPCRRRTRKIS